MNDAPQRFGTPWWLSPFGSIVGLPFPAGRLDQESLSGSWSTLREDDGPARPGPTLPIDFVDQQRGLLGSLNSNAHRGLLGGLTSPARTMPAWAFNPVFSQMKAEPTQNGEYDFSSVRPTPSDDVSQARRAGQLPERQTSPSSEDSAPSPHDEIQSDPRVLSDVPAEDSWIPGARYAAVGHHHIPRAVYGKYPLPEETRKVFDKATTGALPFTRRWHENNALHRAYSDAVEEMMHQFIEDNNIRPENMTPEQAQSLLKVVARSQEPRIRAFGEMLKLMRMLFRLRTGGRGNE